MRTIRLAEASLANGPVRLICGGEIPISLCINPDIVVDALPPLSFGASHDLVDPHSKNAIREIFRKRASAARRVVQEFKPHALVIEMFPFGRKKFADEILSIIGIARTVGNPKILCSVRDVLVTGRGDQAQYDRRAVNWLNEHFDALLIHSDPTLIALDQTFSTFQEIAVPTFYTGYIGSAPSAPVAERIRQIVVSAGGGRVGQQLVQTALDSAASIKERFGLDMFVITGPHGELGGQSATARPGPKTVKFINDLPGTLARSALSISQCGYNTAVDVLQTNTPAVFVPFETAAENEQLRRAELLASRGHAVVLREDHLSPASLLAASATALSMHSAEECVSEIDLAGASRSSDLIRACCANG